MTARKRPTRGDLLLVIGRLHNLIGEVMSVNHDRNPERSAETSKLLQEASALCVSAKTFDPPRMNGEPTAPNKRGWP